jgi:ParG
MDTIKVVIPEDLKRSFKKACIDADTTMSDVVCELVRGWLAGRYKLPKPPAAQKPKE